MDSNGFEVVRTMALVCGVFFNLSAEAVVIDIDSGELDKLMGAGIPLIDIRTSPEWQQTGIVPGSHLLTFFDEQGRADPSAWLDKALRIAKPNEPVIVICRTGNRTKALSQFLSDRAGYAKVYNVRDGITAWAKQGRAIVPATQAKANCRAPDTC